MSEPKAYSYIRFSSPDQKKGDSLRRQLEASERYAKSKGLELDTTLNMKDEGLSAYYGRHRKAGALGKFLDLVEAGKIAPGSLLIIENIDRLSRQPPSESLSVFLSIVNADIVLVILYRNGAREITKESFDNNSRDYYEIMGELKRAYEESKRKSELLSAVWKQKREKARNGNHILTKRSPLWIRLSDDGKEKKFVLTPKRCKAIERIYRMALDGKGKAKIVRELNQDPDVWKPEKSKRNKTGGWQKPYVAKILSDPIVIGTLQPRKRDKDSKKMIAGEPIPNYYPAAIDEKLYYEVQAMRQRNTSGKSTGGGSKKKANNLFVHLVKCGLCGNSMHYFDHGSDQYRYLRCDVSRRKITDESGDLQCDASGVRYDEAEQIIFENLEELNASELLPNEDETLLRLNDIERQLTAKRQQLKELEQGIENISDTIFNTEDKEVRATLEKRLQKAITDKKALTESVEELQTERETAQVKADRFRANMDTAKQVYQLLQDTEDEKEAKNLRLRLRTELQKLVERIDIYPLTEPYKPYEEIEPGILKVMHSKGIDRIRIKFRGSSKKRLILKKTYAERI